VSLLAKIAALEAQLSALRADVKRSDQERAQSEMMVRRLQNQLQAASRRAAESNHLAQSADELRKVLASERSGTALLEVQLQQAHAQTLRLEARLASAEAAVKEGLRREKVGRAQPVLHELSCNAQAKALAQHCTCCCYHTHC
jgi:predicted RNase H-like nuclease (RuvC/YqgF family)